MHAESLQLYHMHPESLPICYMHQESLSIYYMDPESFPIYYMHPESLSIYYMDPESFPIKYMHMQERAKAWLLCGTQPSCQDSCNSKEKPRRSLQVFVATI